MAPGAWRTCGPPRRRWPPRGRRACRGVWSTPRSPLAVRRSPARGRGGLRWARPPAPGQGRDATIAVREYGDAVGTDAHHEAPVVPGGSGAVGVAVDAYVAPLVRPCPLPPGGVEAHAREGHRRREIDGERPRRGLPGPVAGGGVGALAADVRPRVGPGHGRDGRNRDEEASREGGRRRSRRTPSRLPSGGRGTSARGGSGPSPAGTAATRPPSRRASDRPRSRRRAPPRAAPRQRARGSRRAPRRKTPPSRTSLPRSASTSIAGARPRAARARGSCPRPRQRGRRRRPAWSPAPSRARGGHRQATASAPAPALARTRGPSHRIRRGPPPRRVRRRSSSPHGAASPGPRGHAAGTSGTQPVSGPIAGFALSGASGGAGDRSSMLAYLAAVLRTGAERAGDLGRSGPVGARSSDTLSYAEGHGRPSLPPPGGWSRVSVPPGGIVGHGRAPCAGAWPRQCEYRTETDERVARKLMRFLLSSY